MNDLLDKIKRLEEENLLLKSSLSEGEKKYRIFFNNASDPMAILDGNIFLTVNKAVLDILDYNSKEEFINKESAIFSPEYQANGEKSSEKQKEMIAIALQKGTHTFQWQYKKKNDEIIHFEISLTTIVAQGKKHIHSIWRDLTDSKLKDDALEVSEKNYKQIVENNPYSVLVHKKGKVVYCNRSMADLNGVKRFRDIIGLNVLDFVHPDYKKIVFERMKKSSELGIIAPKIVEKLIKINGESYFAEVSAIPIEFENDPATLVIINDISEKIITQEKILNEKIKYKNLVDNLDEGVIEVDIDENITYTNEAFARIVNYDLEKLYSMKLTDLIKEEDYIEVINQSKLRKKGISSKYKIQLISSDSIEKQIILTASPRYDENKAYSGSIGIFYDLSDLEEAGLRIKEVEQINNAVINSSPIGISVRDKNGTLVLHNESWKKIWGLSDDEVRDYYKPKEKLVFNDKDDYLLGLDSDVRRVYKDGGSFYIAEIKALRKKNKNIDWISQYFYAIMNDKKEVDKVVIFTIDISEKKRNERLVKDSEERYKRIYENSITPIYTFDKDKKFIDSNPAGLELLGYSLDELLKLSISDVDANSKVDLPANKGLLAGKNLKNFEHNLRRKNGEIVTVLNNSVPIKNSSGDSIGIQSVLMDISDKVEFEKKLFRLASVIEQSSDSIMITDLKGAIQYVNPVFEVITGYKQEEIVDKNPNILKSGNQDLQFYKDLWETITSKKIWSGTFSNKKKDGTIFYEKATIFPILDDKDIVISYAAIKHDVTKERKLEEQLKQSQKMESIGTLAGGIAHDFNNILTVINGQCQLGQLKTKDIHDKAYEDFSTILNAGKKAAILVRQLLAFSRKETIQPRVLSINTLITDLEKMLRRLISEDIEIKINLTPGILDIKADPNQIEQILINLIVNARDAIIQRQKIEKGASKIIIIETAQSIGAETSFLEDEPIYSNNKFVTFSITDTGYGMEYETKKKIFEPFFTTKEQGKGTGLGLSMVYGVVKQNNAEISVYSDIGKGTTFSIYWPGVEEELKVEQDEEDEFLNLKGNETILLVEDDELIRTFTYETLITLGYKVLEAEDGLEAYNILEKEGKDINLLLTDLVMPKMDGKELSQQALKLFPNIKILFVSGYTKNYLTQSDFLIDDIEFMHKPYLVNDLANKVREVLDS